jgi:hypothetical protein
MISLIVMAGLVPAIHVLLLSKGVDARHKVYPWAGRRPDPRAGHDENVLRVRYPLFGIMLFFWSMIFSENRFTLFGIMLFFWSMIFSENRFTLFGIML